MSSPVVRPYYSTRNGPALALAPRIIPSSTEPGIDAGGLFDRNPCRYACAMASIFRFILIAVAGLALGAATQPGLARITPQHTHDLRCAAAFAVVAAGQAQGNAAALALSPLGIRGRLFMGQVGQRVATETGLSGEAVRDLLASAAGRLGPQGAITAAGLCLGELDTAVPRRAPPGQIDCFAILDTYAQVLAARNPGSALAATLRAEAAALAPATHDPATGHQVDLARARVRDALTGGDATIDADDFAACRRNAKHG